MRLQIGCKIVKLVFIATIVFNTYSLAQSYVFDGRAMEYLGISEIVNKQTLYLFRSPDGLQVWLTDEELNPKKNEVIRIPKSEVLPTLAQAIENDVSEKISSENLSTPPMEVLSIQDSDKIVTSETVMKRESLGSNLSSSLSIEKFGLETLLFNKLESDRIFAKQLEDEKSELLHMMYKQKKLFERVNNNKFSFKNFKLFSKAKIYYIYLPIVLAYYLAV